MDLGTSSCFAGCGLMNPCATDEMTSAKVILPLASLQAAAQLGPWLYPLAS